MFRLQFYLAAADPPVGHIFSPIQLPPGMVLTLEGAPEADRHVRILEYFGAVARRPTASQPYQLTDVRVLVERVK